MEEKVFVFFAKIRAMSDGIPFLGKIDKNNKTIQNKKTLNENDL